MNRKPDLLAEALGALGAGRLDEGLSLAEQACTTMASDPRAHALLARARLARGDADLAAQALEQAFALDPNSVPAWIERAALARLRADVPAMRAALERLVTLAPGHAPFHVDLAALLERTGEVALAESAYRSALERRPADPALRLGRAGLHFRTGRIEAALADADTVLAGDPSNANALSLSGELLMRLGRAELAVPRLQRAVAINPSAWVPQDALLRALKQAGATPDAVIAQAERLGASLSGVFGKTVVAVNRLVLGGPEGAADAIAEAVAMDPRHPMALWLTMQVPPSMVHEDDAAEAQFLSQWRERLAILESLPLDTIDPTIAQTMLFAASSFYAHYLGEPLRDEIDRLGRIITLLAQRAAGNLAAQRRPDDGRVRIGIATGVLRHHTVTKLFGAMITAFDRRLAEITLIHTAAREDDVTRRFVSGADAYLRLSAGHAEVAQAIRARDLDLIVWLDVGMETTGAALAALRLAPVQAVLWGHPVTTGLPSIDVFLSAETMEPADATRHYTERLHRLPGLGTCYTAPSAATTALPAELASGAAGGVLAFMPQMVQKLRPRFDRALARIAAAAPELRLAMTPHFLEPPVRRYRERLARAFAAEGVELDQRLRLCRWVTQAEWLGVAQVADFALDAFDWSGGNTSLEMFWYDTPIVTLPGALMRGRHTMAMLASMELPQLIARDADDYVRIAIELANSADFRAEMRGRIAERKHRLYDDRAVVDAFAAFCTEQALLGRERRLSRDASAAP